MSNLRVALVQTDLQWQAAELNRDLLQAQLLPLAGATDLVVLPEMFTSAFDLGSGAIAEPHPGATLAWMQALAARLDAALTGSIAVLDGGRRYNRLLFVEPSGAWQYYEKRHLFRRLGEDRGYTAGQEKLLLTWRGWRVLPLVCYDLRFPVWCRRTASADYDLLLCVANWPAARAAHWRTLLQARAIENQAWVLGVNRIGRDGNGLDYVGDSAVISPQGETTLQTESNAGVFCTSVSLTALHAWRENFPAWMDSDAFSLASPG